MAARKAVAARIMGDEVQAMFFWYQAANLLIESSPADRVILEHDGVSGMDDVVVYYRAPGVDASGRLSRADFFQVKYHVNQRDAYCSRNLIDPGLTGNKSSLLQRFHAGYRTIRGKHDWFLLNFASNWGWKADDPLAKSIREDGSLPGGFFTDGPKGKLGTARESWRSHLSVPLDEFEDFALRLRFQPHYFNRRDFGAIVDDRLYRAGLRPVPPDRRANPYTDLARKFIMEGPNEFDAKTLTEICDRHDLLEKNVSTGPKIPMLGIRSFMRFAERIESETDRFVCVAKHFDGRHIRDRRLWTEEVVPALRVFLEDSSLREREHHLLLECHGSVAYAAGFTLDRKSGAQVFPVQKGAIREPWKPSASPACPAGEPEWRVEVSEQSIVSVDAVVAISATNPVLADVERYLSDTGLSIRRLIHFVPGSDPSYLSVKGADHAVLIADRVVQEVRRQRQNGVTGTVHLFAAAPNALLFFLGQSGRAMGRVYLYEFDFDNERGNTYTPSFALP